MISVVLCTYNGEKYLEELLLSILHQTVLPDEIIVYDDASNDSTVHIIERYKQGYTGINFRVNRREKNVGWKINFHDALQCCSGKYIFLADQDDIWEFNKIEKMLAIMTDHKEIELLACGYDTLLMDGCQVKKMGTTNDDSLIRVKENNKFMYPSMPGCTFCFKTELIKKMNMCWHPNAPHDQVLWNIAFIDECLYILNWHGIKFRRHAQNASTYYDNRYSYDRYTKKVKEISSNKKLLNNYLSYYKDNNEAIEKIIRFKTWNDFREKMYNHKSILTDLKIVKYLDCYPGRNTYLLDLYLTHKYKKSSRVGE